MVLSLLSLIRLHSPAQALSAFGKRRMAANFARHKSFILTIGKGNGFL